MNACGRVIAAAVFVFFGSSAAASCLRGEVSLSALRATQHIANAGDRDAVFREAALEVVSPLLTGNATVRAMLVGVIDATVADWNQLPDKYARRSIEQLRSQLTSALGNACALLAIQQSGTPPTRDSSVAEVAAGYVASAVDAVERTGASGAPVDGAKRDAGEGGSSAPSKEDPEKTKESEAERQLVIARGAEDRYERLSRVHAALFECAQCVRGNRNDNGTCAAAGGSGGAAARVDPICAKPLASNFESDVAPQACAGTWADVDPTRCSAALAARMRESYAAIAAAESSLRALGAGA